MFMVVIRKIRAALAMAVILLIRLIFIGLILMLRMNACGSRATVLILALPVPWVRFIILFMPVALILMMALIAVAALSVKLLIRLSMLHKVVWLRIRVRARAVCGRVHLIMLVIIMRVVMKPVHPPTI